MAAPEGFLSMDADTALRLTAVALYLAVLVAIGLVASRRMHDLRDYFAAGKGLGYWAAAFSARATGESAWLLLGLTGMGALLGVKAFWVVAGEVLGVAVAWLVMCRPFRRLTGRYDSITVPDYLESRFRDETHLLRAVSAGALVVFVTIYVSAQIDATGTAFENFLGWNYYTGALVGFLVVVAYIISGGFVAVVWSDVFQGAMMVLGLVLLPLAGFTAAGGAAAVMEGLGRIDPALLHPLGAGGWSPANLAGILALALIGLGFMGSPQIFVRFLALKSECEVRSGSVVAIAWTVLADSGAVLTGMVGRHLLTGPRADPLEILGKGCQNVLPLTVENLFPAFLVGVYIAVVLSAIMSTIDSLLVVAGSAAVRDFYQKVFHPEMPDEALVTRSRMMTFALSVAALAVALAVAWLVPGRTVFWFVIFGWSGIAATFCPVTLLSLFWSRLTRRGALAAMITGFLAVPLFKFGAPLLPEPWGSFFDALEELPPAFLLSGLAGLLVSLADRPGQERLADVKAELAQAS